MTTVTYPDLGTLSDIQDADQIAVWRSGPLKTVTGLILKNSVGGSFMPLAGGTMTGALKIANGTEGAPFLSFGSEATTGVFRSAAGNWDVSISGTRRLNLSATGLNVYGAIAGTTLSASGLASLSGGLATAVVSKAAGTLAATDAGKTVIFTSGTTITLPASVLASGAQVILINGTGGDLTITAGAGATVTFLGAQTSTLARGEAATVIANGATLYVKS